LRSISLRNISLRSIPRPMTWCNTPGASNLANLGIPCNFQYLRLIVKHFLHERPPLCHHLGQFAYKQMQLGLGHRSFFWAFSFCLTLPLSGRRVFADTCKNLIRLFFCTNLRKPHVIAASSSTSLLGIKI